LLVHTTSLSQLGRINDVTLSLISFFDIMTQELPSVDWLVDGLMANGDRVVLYGEFGSLKSWLLLDLGIAIAAGEAWLGQFRIPSGKKVLYVDEEMPEQILRRRVRQLGTRLKGNASDVPFQVSSLSGITLGNKEAAEALLEAMQLAGFDPDVIIIETLRRVMVGSELDAQDVGAFWKATRPLTAAGKTVIISHHMRKPSPRQNNSVRDRASGSTDILAGVDTAIAVTRIRKSTLVELETVKCRNADELPPFRAGMICAAEPSCAIDWQFESFMADEGKTPGLLQQAIVLIEEYLKETYPILVRPGAIQCYLQEKGFTKKTSERAWADVRDSSHLEKIGGGWRIKEPIRTNEAISPPNA
jgi:hypothetical protein